MKVKNLAIGGYDLFETIPLPKPPPALRDAADRALADLQTQTTAWKATLLTLRTALYRLRAAQQAARATHQDPHQ
jgi:hypothetical protein